MSTPSSSNPRRDHPSTYFVQDRSHIDEMTRLQIQDEVLTTAMGGPLSEQADPTSFRRVLDVGCGTGYWLLELARTYPSIPRLIGVDVSARMIAYAQAQAVAQQLDDRVEFRTMDALRQLEFPVGYFDLINQRSGAGYLRTWDWPNLLREYLRVTRPGGTIRITEPEWVAESNSPTLTRLFGLLTEAFYEAGHSFTPTSNGVTSQLERLLHQYGLQDIQSRPHASVATANTMQGALAIEDTTLLFRNIVPFLRKWIRVPDDYEALYQQMLQDTQQPDFEARGHLLTAWGIRPLHA